MQHVYLSFHPFVYLSIYLSVCLSVFLSIFLSIYLPIYLSTYLSIYLPIYLPTYRSIDLSIDRSIYLSVCLSIYLPIYLSMRMGIRPQHSLYPLVHSHITSSQGARIMLLLWLKIPNCKCPWKQMQCDRSSLPHCDRWFSYIIDNIPNNNNTAEKLQFTGYQP